MNKTVLKDFLLKLYLPHLAEVHKGLKGIGTYQSYQIAEMNYDDYWRNRPLSGTQPRFPLVAQMIGDGESVLDVGCGDGAMLAYLKDMKGVTEMGIDISRIAVERANLRGVNAQVKLLSDLALASDPKSFDHVIMSEVIEHVHNSEEFLKWGWNLTRKSLIVTFPNIAYFSHRLRILFGRFPVQWVYHPGEHLRFWSIFDFKYCLKQLALPEFTTEPICLPSNGFTWLRFHQRIPNLFGNQIVVKIQRDVP